MSRKLKGSGLAFLAVFAISAIAASAAQAEEQFFHSHKEKTIITGENTGAGHTEPFVFELVPGLPITCTTVKYEGTEEATSRHETEGKATTYTTKTLTVTPLVQGCAVAGGTAVFDTTTNECHFILYSETTETTAGEPMGNVEVFCQKAGGTINVKTLGFEIHIGNQLIPHAVSYETVNTTSETEKQEVTIKSTAKGIAWTCTPKSTCQGFLGGIEGSEAAFHSKVTAKGFEDREKTKTGTYSEGAQTGIFYGPTQ